jgi:hypothetical protein
MRWTKEWPTEPGWYWFYGIKFQMVKDYKDRTDLHPIKVRKIANGVAHIAGSHFLYKAEGADGWWAKMDLPDLPEICRDCCRFGPETCEETDAFAWACEFFCEND